MSTLTIAQTYALARGAGLDPASAAVAVAIAIGESGLRTDAVGDTSLANDTWGPSVGLWQIRSLRADTGTGRARDANRLTDPAFNARAMAQISGAGTLWTPWTVYRNGSWRKNLAKVTQAATGVESDPTLLERLRAGLSRVPVVGDVVDGVAGIAAGGVQSAVTGVGIRLAVVLAGITLLVLGAARLTRSDP